jgi:anti-sigma factor ChrR (cupin superfamily)
MEKKEDEIGPTGEYPNGKLNEQDDGAMHYSVDTDHENQCVIIEFYKPVAWMGLGKEDALMLAKALTSRANKLK